MQSPSTDNHSETERPPVITPPFFWYACFIILAIARIQLGGTPCLQLSIHQSIVDSILAGNDWGRQALIGNLDNPFLPTVALLTVNVICRVFGGNPAVLLCSISQACSWMCISDPGYKSPTISHPDISRDRPTA